MTSLLSEFSLSAVFVPMYRRFITFENMSHRTLCRHNILCFATQISFRDTTNAWRNMVRQQWREHNSWWHKIGHMSIRTVSNAQGPVCYEFISEWRGWCRALSAINLFQKDITVNREIYIEVLHRLRDAVGRKCPEKWSWISWSRLYDNTPAHQLVVKQYLARHCMMALEHPPYSLGF
jgi:hypothetical protein